MRKIILYTAISLDGYISTKDHNLDWLMKFGQENNQRDTTYQEFYNTIDTTLMGNSTYRYVVNEGYDDPYPEKENFVFSRTKHENKTHIQYINEDPVSFTKKLLNLSGGDIWLVGGSEISGLLFEHKMIDTVILTIIPIMLGDGIPLIKGNGNYLNYCVEDITKDSSGSIVIKYNLKQIL